MMARQLQRRLQDKMFDRVFDRYHKAATPEAENKRKKYLDDWRKRMEDAERCVYE